MSPPGIVVLQFRSTMQHFNCASIEDDLHSFISPKKELDKNLFLYSNNKNVINSIRVFLFKPTSKNVIPAKVGIQKSLIILDSRLRGRDKFGIIRGSLKIWTACLMREMGINIKKAWYSK